MTLWLISDTHFTHERILTFTGLNGQRIRPFASVEEMDELIVDNWNSVVKPSDHVYHLGDVAMKKSHLQIVKRLNGHKRLLFGNHDIFEWKEYYAVGFKKFFASRVLNNIICTHIPIHPGSLGRFLGNAHGHIHERPAFGPGYLNLSVEAINYTPMTLEAVAMRLKLQLEKAA